jgi:hypothetical protein
MCSLISISVLLTSLTNLIPGLPWQKGPQRTGGLQLGVHALVVPKECKKQHDRQRYAEQPKQSASSKAHDVLLQFVKAERLACGVVPTMERLNADMRWAGRQAPAGPDYEGRELPDGRAAWHEATITAGQILQEIDGKLAPGREWRVQVADELITRSMFCTSMQRNRNNCLAADHELPAAISERGLEDPGKALCPIMVAFGDKAHGSDGAL